ncbi:hypothetical protein F5888DRAFT_1844840 [Russula emetica]|nr:hypothetical protein F5888DRAFT_1844840 [Russula emetica]
MDIRKNDVRVSSIQSYKYARDLAKMLKTEITYRVIKEEKKDIKKKNICNVFSEDTTLNGSTNAYDFIGVYTLGVLDGSQPKTVLTVSTTRGIHIMPPTRMTSLMLEALTPAFLKDSTFIPIKFSAGHNPATTLVNNILIFASVPLPSPTLLPAFKYCTPVNTFNWTEFIGGGIVRMKICNPNGTNPVGYCQHTLDRIGLPYNMSNTAQNGTFEVCDSGLMDIPGVYTSGGQTLSYSQPAETVSIGSLPYTPRIPSSSNCQIYQSTQIFTDFASLASSTTGALAAPIGSGASHAGSIDS